MKISKADELGAANIGLHLIVESPWNVHGKEKDETMDGLVESIKTNGIIQRLVVRPLDGGAKYELVDGHRRFYAAELLGLKTVPCEVKELDDAAARAATLAANVQRLDNDPLLEAALIGLMHDDGMAYGKISAALGKSEGYIARRARLTSLADCWRKAFAEIGDVPAWLMEKVAAHDAALQMAVYEEWAGGIADFADYELDQSDCDEIDGMFEDAMRELDAKKCPFDMAECATCDRNTANHGLLFPELADKCGRCQDAECFAKKWNEAADVRIAALKSKGANVVAVRKKWDVPNEWNATAKKTKENTVPYVYERDGLRHLVWSVPKPETARPEREAKTAEEKAAEKAEKKRAALAKSARKKIAEAAKEYTARPEFRDSAEFNAVAARRFGRELELQPWRDASFVDDIAMCCGAGVCAGLAEEEAEAYNAELKRLAESGKDAE